MSVYYASLLLDLLFVPHAVFHYVIELSDRQLFVVEACSGVQSVYALGFLSLLLVAIKRRSIIAVPFYLGTALVLALACNVMRITAVGVAADWYKVDLAKGVAHEAIGYLAISVAGLLLLSFDHLFATLLKPVPETRSETPLSVHWNQFSGRLLGAPLQPSTQLPDGRSKNGAVARVDPGSGCSSPRPNVSGKAWKSKLWVVGMLGFASLLLVGSLTQVAQSNRPPRRLSDDRQLIFAPPGPLARVAFEHLQVMDYQSNRRFAAPRLGPNSDVWHCLLDGLSVEVVLSQPHRGWHELSDCYERKHWRLLDRQLITPTGSGLQSEVGEQGEAANYVSAIYRRGAGHYGRLIFAAIGSDGVPVDAPGNLVAFYDRAWKRLDRRGVWRQQETLMLQMWIVSDRRLTDTQLERLTADFESPLAAISEQLITQLRPARHPAMGSQRSVTASETEASDQEQRFLSAGAVRGDQQ